jgi:hypothetical protein
MTMHEKWRDLDPNAKHRMPRKSMVAPHETLHISTGLLPDDLLEAMEKNREDPSRLERRPSPKIAEALGAAVVIPVTSTADALVLHGQRQIRVRELADGEMLASAPVEVKGVTSEPIDFGTGKADFGLPPDLKAFAIAQGKKLRAAREADAPFGRKPNGKPIKVHLKATPAKVQQGEDTACSVYAAWETSIKVVTNVRLVTCGNCKKTTWYKQKLAKAEARDAAKKND